MQPISRGRLVVDSRVSTGLALAKPFDTSVRVTLTLRRDRGEVVDATEITLSPGEHLARFISEAELFGNLSDPFLGMVSFEAEPGRKVAALTIRQAVNRLHQPLFATLPVVDLDEIADWDRIVFPQVGAGSNLSTQIV